METHPYRNIWGGGGGERPTQTGGIQVFLLCWLEPCLLVGSFVGSDGAGSTGPEAEAAQGHFISVTLREGVPCRARGGGVSLPGGQKRAGYVKRNQAAKSWRSCLLSPARAIKCGIKEETAPWLIGPIQEELVPKFFDRAGFYSEPQLISPAAQWGFRGLIKTR